MEQYKSDLYTKAYLEGLVKKNIDTVVDIEEAKVFYEANKESFKLNDDLLQFRYVSLPLNPIDLDTIKNRFKRFETKDKRYLDSISVQFKSYSLNDSLWVKYNQVVEKVSVVKQENKNAFLSMRKLSKGGYLRILPVMCGPYIFPIMFPRTQFNFNLCCSCFFAHKRKFGSCVVQDPGKKIRHSEHYFCSLETHSHPLSAFTRSYISYSCSRTST